MAFALVGAVVAAYVIERSFVAAHRTLGWAVACSVVALLLDPVVQWLTRWMPRVLAIVVSMFGVVAVTGLVVVRIVSELRSSANALQREAPEAAMRLEQRSSVARDLHVVDTVRSFAEQLARDLNQETIAHVKTAPTYLVTGILMLFLLSQGRRYVGGALRLIGNDAHRRAVSRIVAVGLGRGRDRLLSVLFQVIVVTLSSLVVFELLDLKASFILALLMGVASVMPVIGVLIAGIPAAVIAYGFHGLAASLTVGAFVLVVEAVDVLWWRARCDRRTVEVGLLMPLVAAIIGYRLYRIGGAVYGYALVVLALAMIAASDLDDDANPSTWGSDD